jgi:hypothetical protein
MLPAAGRFEVSAGKTGYVPATLSFDFAGQDTTIPAIVLVPQAVPLDPIDVTAGRREPPNQVGFSRPSMIVHGERMAMLERNGAKPITVVGEISSLRLRNMMRYTTEGGQVIRNYVCISSLRRFMDMRQRQCEPVVLIIDGIPVGDPYDGLRNMQLSDLESIELVPPVEAGYRYGPRAAGTGALVVWTRGRGPHRSDARDGRSDR